MLLNRATPETNRFKAYQKRNKKSAKQAFRQMQCKQIINMRILRNDLKPHARTSVIQK